MVNSALGLKLLDPVVSKAKTWGFICQCQESNSWLILPQNPDRRWKLQQVEERWILSVGDIPQLRLNPEDAITFLERQNLER